MNPATQQVIHDIHAAGAQVVLEFTGAGSLALAQLHAVPGSSRTILEATDRYSPASLNDLLGRPCGKPVEIETAAAMARAAYLRATRLGDDSRPRLGIACTATIATDHPKRGLHRCCLAVQDHHALTTYDLVLAKGRRDRQGEEELIAAFIVDAIAQAAGVSSRPPLPLLEGEQIIRQTSAEPDPVESLWAGSAAWVLIDPSGARRPDAALSGLVYSGSFDPLHYGHEALAAAASRVSGLPITFELAAVNAEKAPLTRGELERRLAQFQRRYSVAVTRWPLFADKARHFPGCTFVVGFDTAVRLVQNRFYGGSDALRDQALAAMLAAGSHVLVAGRVQGEVFKTLADLPVPAAAGDLFIDLPCSEFRADVSATDLRNLCHGG